MFLVKEKNELMLKENKERRENKQRAERDPWSHSYAEYYGFVYLKEHHLFAIYVGTNQLGEN